MTTTTFFSFPGSPTRFTSFEAAEAARVEQLRRAVAGDVDATGTPVPAPGKIRLTVGNRVFDLIEA